MSILYDRGMHIEEIEIDPDWSFLRSQRAVLLRLRQELFEVMVGVTVFSRSEGGTSLVKTHPADAGTDAYDRDFAVNLLSHKHDALYEIDQALERIELGTYGICERSGRPIPHERLKAIPFARFTVEVQSRIERDRAPRVSEPTRSLFIPADSERSEEQHRDDESLAYSED